MRPGVVLALLSAIACATSPAKVSSTAIDRAAFDLSCPSSSLQATPIGDTTRVGVTPQSPGVERTVVGVSGCDQKAVYVVECVAGACNAILNAEPSSSSPPAPPAPPASPAP
jgi:hypothetical protein